LATDPTIAMSSAGADPEPQPGWVDAELAAEFPDMGLAVIEVDVQPRASPRAIQERLSQLSNRFYGVHAITMRQAAIPAAYRVFFRHVGLDPDSHRTPIEAAAFERLLSGGFVSRNLVDDALLIGLLETGVPIWALDSARVSGPLGIRAARPGERLGRTPDAPPLASGSLVVADADSALAVLFGELAPGHGVVDDSRRMTLFAVHVAGVPAIHVDEALWTCATVLES
jgi:DNA/RNA-binding domain of Phe-tRNA-synthetase-like protein